MLGLDEHGRLVVMDTSRSVAMDTGRKETTRSLTRSSKPTVIMTPKPRPLTSQSLDYSAKKRDPTPIMTSQMRPKTSLETVTEFDGDVGELVGKMLEESNISFIRAVEIREKKGFISKPDFKELLKFLRISLKAIDLEHFLARNGLRRNDGLINSRLLIRRLQSRSSRGLLNKVMRNQEHLFHATTPPQTPLDGASALHLETKLVEIFQREFLALLSAFRQFDPNGTGFLTLEEFRVALEHRFTTRFTDQAWNNFVNSSFVRLVSPPSNATQGQLGYVAYNDFLAKYDVMLRPSTADEDDPWKEQEVDVAALREHKDRYTKSMDVDPKNHMHRHEPRPLEQLEATLVDVFVYKFHNFKKEYDIIVREDFCRVDKEKFDYILFRCGFVLTPSELSRLWLSMPITRPMESLSIPTILQHVMRLYYSTLLPGKFSKTSRDSSIVSHVLEKIREPVVSHWSVLKKKLRFLDPMGTSRIPKEDILTILNGLRPNILDMELLYLVEMLESRVPGKTNYFRLMEYYAKNPKRKKPVEGAREPLLSSDSMRYSHDDPVKDFNRPKQHNYCHPNPVKPDFISLRNAPSTSPFKRVTMHPTMTKQRKLKPGEKRNEAAEANPNYSYRGNYTTLQRHPLSAAPSNESEDTLVSRRIKPQVGSKDLPSLTRALRKEDTDDVGKIPVQAFRKILSAYGVNFKSNDLYKLLSRYDRNMSQKVSYERFLKAMA
nr:EF-hand calcium-binding domain-containing protein 6-like [Ciona intestinalis]|eukprot:XP_026693646.1 EF-hand calcium-binding domain-containing protein 6-like [Ciona intestinalis]